MKYKGADNDWAFPCPECDEPIPPAMELQNDEKWSLIFGNCPKCGFSWGDFDETTGNSR